jgi:hypothetical protein
MHPLGICNISGHLQKNINNDMSHLPISSEGKFIKINLMGGAALSV